MMSKPAVQNVTAAVSSRMRGSSEPRTAIQAAAGPMPSANPRKICDQRVKRLVKEYRRITAKATGESISVNRFNWEAARTKIPHAIRTNVLTNDGVNRPIGNARVAVRGLAASIEASARRLKAIAAERAETMATMIQASCRHSGKPPAASMAPQSAKGSAKMECSHLIISSVIFRFRRKATQMIVKQGCG